MKIVGVVGSGTMGSGIAQVVASSDRDVLLVDISDAALDRGIKGIEKSLGRLVKKEAITEEDSSSILSRIVKTTDFEGLGDADLVIEAVFEDMDVKKEIYSKLDNITGDDVVLATNTSSLPIVEIAVSTSKADKIVGMHFFNPAPVMKLVEIIKTLTTSDETVQFAYDFALALGKEPVKTKDSPGFIVNRILIPMLNEAVFAYQDGVGTPEDIDKAMKLGTNQPIGPLALVDLIGLDITLDVMDTFYREFQDSKFRAAPLLRQMVRAGWLGRKSGKGFFDYS
ncbi:MAG: 3-hydroxybutyryl-CoA dehydrogenase [Candidatus Dadabacteria bacterium]|nr:3-hydroxybutyryl-CoA dehydrogenase [Candidatus Dadabacteria bacterium]TDI89765.1 MAG: 3-hydroxybutyryl-CoA dehydrogenase [Candidatus Dadabacteria bacterium]TDI99448.1 MAG: 3-hydroxybutyryl-CoA dehydrogenase [Candidatus Dadabacteria bacterium]